jgi:hypothetical protein
MNSTYHPFGGLGGLEELLLYCACDWESLAMGQSFVSNGLQMISEQTSVWACLCRTSCLIIWEWPLVLSRRCFTVTNRSLITNIAILHPRHHFKYPLHGRSLLSIFAFTSPDLSA